jgi:L-fucose isomerase-like protein
MSKIFYLDLLERVLWTFVQGFLAVWILLGSFSKEALYAGLIAGAISAAKGLIATQIGSSNSASTLPSPPDFAVGDTAESD